jgi:hypothetical protein
MEGLSTSIFGKLKYAFVQPVFYFAYFTNQIVAVNNKVHAGCLNGHNDFNSQNFINIDGINL